MTDYQRRGEIYLGWALPGSGAFSVQGTGRGGNPVIQLFGLPAAVEAGSIGPGVYSLGTRSTVPFIQIKGTDGFNKIASWGELIEVPNGQMATVANASHHAGDIFLNQGEEPGAMPSRITIGTPFVENSSLAPDDLQRFLFPNGKTATSWIDCRRARTVYFVTSATVPAPGATFGKQGQNIDVKVGPYNPAQNQPSVFFPNNRYQEIISLPGGTQLDYFELGWRMPYGVRDFRAMALFEKARVFVPDDTEWPQPTVSPPDGLYVVEY